ncbi:MAG: LytR C-terminal domain-containing protein [Elusimicrobia bacterium]|nr:LytR C-terminal domain-containing protein [Elusimicrobiota bacterium]
MERHRRLTLIERALGLALMGAVGLVGFLESRSPMAEAARAKKPWLFFLALDSTTVQGPPELFLGVYDPRKPLVETVYLPGGTLVDKWRSLDYFYAHDFSRHGVPERAAEAEAAAAGAWLARVPALAQEKPVFLRGIAPVEAGDMPPLQALAWVRRPVRNLLAAPTTARGLSGLDRLFLALRLSQISRENAVPAWLPDRQDVVYDFFGRLVSGQEPAMHRGPVTVEIENAAGIPNLALDATKILRSRGADVVSESNAAKDGARTVVYDRTGRIQNARAVKRMLSCPSAEVLTRVDPGRLVDVSVILGADCAQAAKETGSWNSSRF